MDDVMRVGAHHGVSVLIRDRENLLACFLPAMQGYREKAAIHSQARKRGLIRKRPHPHLDLYLYNYEEVNFCCLSQPVYGRE